MQHPRHHPPQRLEIYDGQIRAGVIVRRGGKFIARDARGRELGAFTTLRDAVRVIPAAKQAEAESK
jgi:hypothetical protein